MTVTAVDLLPERRASRQRYTRLGADCRTRNERSGFTAHTRLRHAVTDRQTKSEPEERARMAVTDRAIVKPTA